MTVSPTRVALVGLRGSGKTTLGRALAARLDLPFHDADQVLQQKEGCSIAQVFAEKGQEWFREREAQCLAELAQEDRWVIACGGGAVLREDNRNLLARRACVVWLDADPEILARRIFLDPQSSLTRPALITAAVAPSNDRPGQNRGLDAISAEMALLAGQRREWYRSVCHFRLDTGAGTPAEWIEDLLKWWKDPSERSGLAGASWK